MVRTELFRRCNAFAVIKNIQPTDQRFALPLIILHAKQLDAGTGRRTKEGFYFIFVHDLVQGTGSCDKFLILFLYPVFACLFAELFEVTGFQYTCIFLYLLPFRINRPLPDLMRKNGDVRT